VKSGPKPAASPRKNGQRWLSAIPPQGGFLFIPASFFGFRLFFKAFLFISIAAVIAPRSTLPWSKSRLSHCHRAYPRSKASAASRASFSVSLGAYRFGRGALRGAKRRSQVLECRQVAAPGREVGLAKTAERSARIQRQVAAFGLGTFGFADGIDAAKCARPPGPRVQAPKRVTSDGRICIAQPPTIGLAAAPPGAWVVPSEKRRGLTPRHVDSADGT
jgi:hypothetical protein